MSMDNKELVWVVDDDESIRWVLEKGLTEEGMEVKTFESAHQVLKKIGDGISASNIDRYKKCLVLVV